MVNIILAMCLLYIFSWIFIGLDNLMDLLVKKIQLLGKKEEKITRSADILDDLKTPWLRDKYLYIYRFFLHIKETPTDIRYYLRQFVQRGIKGYAKSDVWGFDYYLSKVIVKGLKDLKEMSHGYPCGMVGSQAIALEKNDKGMKEWKKILDEIIWTFEVTLKVQDKDWVYIPLAKYRKKFENQDKKRNYHIMTKTECERYKKGWKLFQQYYFDLWD